LSRRNPFYFEKGPEDCPVVKAFEANKIEIIKLFMKRLASRNPSPQLEKIMQSILFHMINKYHKQKDTCYHVFKALGEASMTSIINKARDGQLLLNEAITRKDSALIKELLTLSPDIHLKDDDGT
jgi:hypothetical protein